MIMIARRIAVTTAAAIAMCGGLSFAAAGASASSAGTPITASPVIDGAFLGVSASSAADAWAVGSDSSRGAPPNLAEHWNGKTWANVPVPSPPGSSGLGSVTDISATDAWAASWQFSPVARIFHWNGKKWSQTPIPAGATAIHAVSGLSPANAWAVGSAGSATLVLHWNGKAWKRVPSPNPGSYRQLAGLTVTSADSAWAVGSVSSGDIPSGLILHWNGKTWKRVPSPNPAGGQYGNALQGVTARSAASAWAVGCSDECTAFGGRPQIEHWNGTSWKQAATPATPFSVYSLDAVAATSTGNIWAVGDNGPVTSEYGSIVHGNGKTWTLAPGVRNAGLNAVAAISASNAWAVGNTITTTAPFVSHPLILHWNGKTWTREH
jgi:hypothetical protein